MINEHEQVVLTDDLPEYHLRAGDIATVILIHNQGEGYGLEFISVEGETIAVVSVYASQVRRLKEDEVALARVIQSA